MAQPTLLLEVIGTVAFAVSGAAVAARSGMDWLGIAVLGAVTAVGGGTLRDLLLGQQPVSWIQHPWPVWVALVTAAAVIVQASIGGPSQPDSLRLFLVADALGLATFTVAGTLLALQSGVSAPQAVILGVVTGTGGGVIRDVLAGRQPLVLVGQIYALTAVAGGVVLALMVSVLDTSVSLSRWTAILVILVLRMLAVRFSWTLPRPHASELEKGV